MYVAIDQVELDQDMRDPVDQRQIRPRLERQVQIRHHGGLRHPRVGHDQSLVAIGFQILAQNRMIVGHIRADQQDHVGPLHVFVVAGRAIAAERQLVARNGAWPCKASCCRRSCSCRSRAVPACRACKTLPSPVGRCSARPAHPVHELDCALRKRSTIVASASSQLTRSSLPFLRSSGYLARFSAPMV